MLQKMDFELVPFRNNDKIISLMGKLDFSDGVVSVSYELTGNLEGLNWPESGPGQSRAYGLWEHTCLELFIGSVACDGYHEVNLSPAGNWNCFSFTDVRVGMKESDTLTLISLESMETNKVARLSAVLDFKRRLPDSLQIGLSAVIEMGSNLHYYALSHGSVPDFHAREHHTLRHPEQLHSRTDQVTRSNL